MSLVVQPPVTMSGLTIGDPVMPATVAVPQTVLGGFSSVSPEEIAEAVEEYFNQNPTTGEPALAAHLIDPTPHPVYDEMPSLTLIFENGLI